MRSWRFEESWGDRSREAGVTGEALTRVRGKLAWRQGQQTAKRRAGGCPLHARWRTGAGDRQLGRGNGVTLTSLFLLSVP